MKILKKIMIMLILTLIVIIQVVPVFASALDGIGDIDGYKPSGAESTKLQSRFNIIFSVISSVGVVLSVIILIVIGIKFMLGSVEERANYKKSFVPYLVGAAILFTGSLLPQFIYEIVKQVGLLDGSF